MMGGTPPDSAIGGRITKMKVWLPFVFFRPKYQAVSGIAT
jgi:hypothetical protein